MGRSNKEKAVNGIYWMALMSGANILIKLVIMMCISRVLLPTEIGAVASIQIIISFAEVFWMMGVGPALVQKKDLSATDINTGNILNIIFGIIVYGLIFVFSVQISNFFGIESIQMLLVLSLVFIIHSVSGVSESLLQKEMKFKLIGIINISSMIVYGFIAIALSIFGFGAWSLIFAQLCQVVLTSFLSILKRPVKIKLQINKLSAMKLLNFGLGFTLSKVFNTIANQGDYLVVSKFLGSTTLGFYNRAYQILLVPTSLIGTVVDKVLFPLISKYQDKLEKVRYMFLNISALTALLALPVTILTLIMGSDIVQVVLGKQWGLTVLPLKILIIGLFFRMAYKICDSLVKSLGAVYKRLWIQIVYALFVVVGALIGKEWGITGVAISTSIAIFVNYILMVMLIRRLINLKIKELINYLKPVFYISCFIGTVCYLFSFLLLEFSFPLIRLCIMTILVIVLYFISFKYYLLKAMPVAFKEFITTILGSTTKKFGLKVNKI